MKMVKKINERGEAFFRIIVLIVSGIILEIWGYIVCLFAIVNWFIVIITGERNRDLAELCEYWNTENYKYYRYLTFVSNKRPFPFSDMERFSVFK
jgi:hypothetical protein